MWREQSVKIAKVAISTASYAIDKLYDYKIPANMQHLQPGTRVLVPFGRGNRRTEGMVLSCVEGTEQKGLKAIDRPLDQEPLFSPAQIRLALWFREQFFCTFYEAVKAMLPAGIWYKLKRLVSIAPGVDRETAYEAAGKSKIAGSILDYLYTIKQPVTIEALQDILPDANISAAIKKLIDQGILQEETVEWRRVRDKMVSLVSLAVPAEEGLETAARKRSKAPMQAEILATLAVTGEVPIKELLYFTGAKSPTVKALEKAGLVQIRQEEVFRNPQMPTVAAEPIRLNQEQENAYRALSALLTGKPAAALLYGVTGSGKTAVYIRLIQDVLQTGRQALVLVPEISLTPQLTAVFMAHLGERVAVLHSSLGTGERYDAWKRIRSGQVDVVIGTRSAVFAPLEHLGLLIVDEEQEGSYKSESSPRYHARDIAKYRCVQDGALLLLGSATPSVESMYQAEMGRYHLCRMENRYNSKPLPKVLLADMKEELRQGNGGEISALLQQELAQNLERGEQSILFLNRRGASSLVVCGACGYTYSCPRCSVSLTYHRANGRMMCHYCGYSEKVAEVCPECGSPLKYFGAGTQKIEAELHALFPDVPVLRMDADTVSPAHAHEALLTRFSREKIPILVGTQMVTKGLNFDDVTLVGVLNADQSLHVNDYRAQERTFSLITQVIGRAGRGEKAGRAVIQTFTPDNEVIQLAARQDYDGFYQREIVLRRLLNCPPMTDLFTLTACGLQEADVLRCCTELKNGLTRYWSGGPVEILGPAPAGVTKVMNRYRYRLTIRTQNSREVRNLISHFLRRANTDKRYKGVSVYGDVNPLD